MSGELRPEVPTATTAHDLINLALRTVEKVEMRLHDHKATSASMRKDAETIAQLLMPRVRVVRRGGKVTEAAATEKDLHQVEGIVLHGNNDLKQIDHAARLYALVNNEKCKIYLSGFGGHTTTPVFAFGKTEAATIRQRLIDLGVPANRIVEETQASSPEESLLLLVEKMRKEKAQPRQLLICGTPAATLRQMRTFEGVVEIYPWESLTTYPPENLSAYYETERDSTLNLLSLLRELGSFLDYTVNSSQISSRPIADEAALKRAIGLFATYHSWLQPRSAWNEQQLKQFTESFLKFSRMKGDPQSLAKEQERLKWELAGSLADPVRCFREEFARMELAWVKNLARDLPAQEHRHFIEKFATYLTHVLELPDAPNGS